MSLKNYSRNTISQEPLKQSQTKKENTSFDPNRLTQSEINSLRKNSQEAGKFFIHYFKEHPLV